MPKYIHSYAQRISGPADASQQRALELVTQQMRQVIAELTALQLGRQLRQKGAE